MRTLLASLAIAAGLAVSASPADACSIRGRFCGYPFWAANAFEGARGQVNPNSGPVLPQVYGYRPEVRYAPRYQYRASRRRGY